MRRLIGPICAGVLAACAHAQPSLTIISQNGADTPHSYATAVSADGRVVAGFAIQPQGIRAFRWDADTGLVLLDAASIDPNEQDAPFAINTDGSVVVGYRSLLGVPIGVLWDDAGAVTETGAIGAHPGNGLTFSNAAFCDPTGSVVVGLSTTSNGQEAVLWTAADGFTPLGGLNTTGNIRSEAVGLDADGVVYGHTLNDDGNQVLFKWTQADGMSALPFGPFEELDTNDASPDGRTLAGSGLLPGSTLIQPMLRTPDGTVRGLPMPAGATQAAAFTAPDGGHIVFGRHEPADTAPGTSSFLWTEDLGSVDLNEYVINELGIVLGDWLLYPEDTDATGDIVVGAARYHPNGSPFAIAEAAFVLDLSYCEADLNRDAMTNFFDLAQYIGLFNAGDLAADIDENGTLNFFDVAGYLNLFAACQ